MVDLPAAEALAADLARLQAAAVDLWYPSEIDAPLAVVQWDQPTLEATLANPSRPLTCWPGEVFFQPILANPFWRSPQGDHLGQRYAYLKQLLWSTLTEIHTYRSTAPEVTLYLIGRHPSGLYLGLRTLAVET
jgi:hypothetical protein